MVWYGMLCHANAREGTILNSFSGVIGTQSPKSLKDCVENNFKKIWKQIENKDAVISIGSINSTIPQQGQSLIFEFPAEP